MDSKLLSLLFLASFFSGCSIDSKTCEKDADCFSGEVCNANSCIPTDANNGMTTNNIQTKDCEKNADCSFGFCKKPEGICECPVGEHLCDDRCISDIDPVLCGGCTACPVDSRGTTTCLPSGDCAIECSPPFQPCTGDACPRACIGCSDNSNCGHDSPICLDNECTDCQSDDDCTGFSQKICNAGSCVQCTETMPGACTGNSCDPATSRCTETRLRSREDCEPCVSDLECKSGFGCVKMNFAGALLDGGYCLEKFDGNCSLPFPVRVSKISLSTGQSAEYCGISESIITCKSYTDFGNLCETPNECGLKNFDDAQCRPVFGIDRCTYNCTNDDDCPGGSFCANQIYCLQN